MKARIGDSGKWVTCLRVNITADMNSDWRWRVRIPVNLSREQNTVVAATFADERGHLRGEGVVAEVEFDPIDGWVSEIVGDKPLESAEVTQ